MRAAFVKRFGGQPFVRDDKGLCAVIVYRKYPPLDRLFDDLLKVLGISSESNLVPGDGAVLCDPGTLYLYRCCLRVKLSRRKSLKRGYRYCGCKNDRYGSSKLFFHISSLSVRYKASDMIPVCGAKGSPDTKHSIHIIIQFIRVVNQASGKHKIVAIPPVLWYHCS